MSVVLEGPPMAKKAAKRAASSPGRPPAVEGPKRQVLGIRAGVAYKDWLKRFAEHERSDMVDLVDDALAAYAKAQGFEPPPKR